MSMPYSGDAALKEEKKNRQQKKQKRSESEKLARQENGKRG